ncbi:MAG: ATP-grasp domain-containing protein [Planctomycetaceae bacterium]|nr:ATP-grasp domain-containing protein [Planctomycetaceae bacterium]
MLVRHGHATADRPRLLITGASTRAAAWSAIRAGFFPVCADRFGDEDLRQIAEVHDYDQVHTQFDGGKPAIVATARIRISERNWTVEELFRGEDEGPQLKKYLGPLLGPDAMRSNKADSAIPNMLRDAGLPFLKEKPRFEVLPSSDASRLGYVRASVPPAADGTWIEKSIYGSGGGYGVRLWDADAAGTGPLDWSTYFQEYRSGQPMSAIFLTDSQATLAVELIGLTEQLIGDQTAAAPTRFTYCGNIAPVSLPDEATAVVKKIGAVLAAKLELRGIFGVDFIWDGTTPWVIEVNPRYTASCELLELGHGRALLRDHWQAWLPNEPLSPLGDMPPKPRAGVIGKLILYARSEVAAPDLSRFLRPRSAWTIPFLADIPRVGTRFSPGEPMCTVFATAHNAAECRQKLVRRARRVRKWFGDLPDPLPEPSSVLD